MPRQESTLTPHYRSTLGPWRAHCSDCGAVEYFSTCTLPFICGCQVSYPDILRDLAIAADRAAFELKEARAEHDLQLSRMSVAEVRYQKAGAEFNSAKDALIDHLDASAKSNK